MFLLLSLKQHQESRAATYKYRVASRNVPGWATGYADKVDLIVHGRI